VTSLRVPKFLVIIFTYISKCTFIISWDQKVCTFRQYKFC